MKPRIKPRTNGVSQSVGGAVGVAPLASPQLESAKMPALAPTSRPIESNPFGSWALAFYVFLFGSLSVEFFMIHAGFRFPLIGPCFILIFLIYLFCGRPLRFAETRFFLPWFALLFWWLLAAATGIYRGRSIPVVLEYAIRIHTLPLIFCGIVLDLRGMRRLLYGCAMAVPVLLVACFMWGTMSQDRFFIPNTSSANANDLALRLLLFGVLFLVFLGRGMVLRFISILTLPVLIYYILKTGSRANLVTMAIIMVTSLFLLPGAKKAIPILAILGFFCAIPFVQQSTLNRLSSFFHVAVRSETFQATDATELAESAVASTNGRMQLQWRAIQLTMEHPLLGVGPLNFEDGVEAMVQKNERQGSGWQVAHNSYLQVAADTGVPGAILFAWIIWMCLKTNYQSFRRSEGEAALISFVILLASMVYAFGILFCSVAYDFYLPLLVGLTAANLLALRGQQNPFPGGAARQPMSPARSGAVNTAQPHQR
jgi:O-antigen ligase